MTRLLIIDDDEALSTMLSEYLAGEGFHAEWACDGEAGIAMATAGSYDALILDIMMPGLDGIEVLRRLRRTISVPIIMLTARGDSMDRVTGLEMGADDYVSKPYHPLELVARIRAVLRRVPRGAIGGEEGIDRLGLHLNPRQRLLSHGGVPIDVTVSEFNIMEALIRTGTDAVSKDDLTLQALGKARDVYDRSLDVHISNLRNKLRQAGVNQARIQTVRGFGYRLEEA